MLAFANRNLKIYFRDKVQVFFSLLGVLVVIGLYVLFLGESMLSSMDGIARAKEMMDSWVMAGVLAITGMTVSLGVLGAMVMDESNHIVKDFQASPIKRSSLMGGYFLGSYVVSVLMSLIALGIAELYIVLGGGVLMSVGTLCKVVLVILLTCFMNTAIILFVVSLFKSTSAYGTASTVVGTLIGFLTGIYLPIGEFSPAIQWVVKLFPVSQAAAVLRQLMMEDSMTEIFATAPIEMAAEVKEELGVYFRYGDYQMPMTGSILVILAVGMVFFTMTCLHARGARK